MKKTASKKLILLGIAGILLTFSQHSLIAGNKDRSGQAGGNELLINPWARSSGWGGANSATAVGLEAMHLNVAGLAFINKTELVFARTSWLKGSDINLNAFGFTQRVGEQGIIGLAIMSMDFGDIPITTVNLPEGGLGTFSPQFLNMGISYAREFSNSIYGGLTIRTISESLPDIDSKGIAFDAGIRYITGKQDQVKFGIALKNVGPKMQFSGDGFATKVTFNDEEMTLEQRTEPYELPSLLNIGFGYDFFIGAKLDSATKKVSSDHRITAAGNFTSNSFGKDQIRIGVEYGFKSYFMVRAGFVYEEGITKISDRTTAYTGPTAGVTFQMPMGKGGSSFALDYSYRATNPFQGTHSIGFRINI